MRFCFSWMKACTLLLALFAAAHGYAQIQRVEWQKGPGGQYADYAQSVIQTKDGGYLMSGTSQDISRADFHGRGDIWLLKLDRSGNKQWDKLYGGSAQDEVKGNTIVEVSDGFIVAGSSSSNDGDVTGNHNTATAGNDVWLFKVDFAGNLVWQKSIGGSGSERASSLILTPNMELLIAGETDSDDGDISGKHKPFTAATQDLLLIKTDLTGNIIWQKCFGGSQHETAYEINALDDGSFLALAFTKSNDGDVHGFHSAPAPDLWLLRIDAAGNRIIDRCIGGTGTEYDASFAQKKGDQGFMIALTSNSNDDIFSGVPKYEYNLLRLDNSLNVQWMKTYGGSNNEAVGQIISLPQGGYLLGGITFSTDGNVGADLSLNDHQGIWLLQVDDTGAKVGSIVMGGSYNDVFSAIQPTRDSGCVFAGFSYSSDGTVTGVLGHGDYDAWIVKLATPVSQVSVKSMEKSKVEIFPTVTDGIVHIRMETAGKADLSVYNSLGAVIRQIKIDGNQALIDLTQQPAGSYFFTMRDSNKTGTLRVIKR